MTASRRSLACGGRAGQERLGMMAEMPNDRPFGAKTLYVLLRFARWDDVLALPSRRKAPILTTLYHFGGAWRTRRSAPVLRPERIGWVCIRTASGARGCGDRDQSGAAVLAVSDSVSTRESQRPDSI